MVNVTIYVLHGSTKHNILRDYISETKKNYQLWMIYWSTDIHPNKVTQFHFKPKTTTDKSYVYTNTQNTKYFNNTIS